MLLSRTENEMQQIKEQISRTEGCLVLLEEAGSEPAVEKIQERIQDVLDFIGLATMRLTAASLSDTPVKYRRLLNTVFAVEKQAKRICSALRLDSRYTELWVEVERSIEMFSRFLAGNASLMVVSWVTDMSVEH